jgi:hypothetical protein
MRHLAIAVVVVAPALWALGCSGRVVLVNEGDGEIVLPDADDPPSDGSTPVVDGGKLPGPGEPCPGGECTEDALCVAFTGYCEPKCTLPGPCNAKMPECADDRYCYDLTSFWGVCMIADAALGDRCGRSGGGAKCQGGTMCVQGRDTIRRCMALCDQAGDTCPGGEVCTKVADRECHVCPPPSS